ncbi:MAG: hypothetical protein J5769_00540 [Bacteroidales bacterium]|nr:hypothetical protein [Bacteroidales bacterium]
MKRLLSLFAAVVLLLPFTSSCKDVDIVVTATVSLTYYDMSTVVTCGPADFGPYHHYNLSGYELESILMKLTTNVNRDFAGGIMHLDFYDRIQGVYLEPRDFTVLWDDGERDWIFQEMP